MCRIAAYLGPPIFLEKFLLQPPHSLVEQASAPREMQESRLNADGFGFGWFSENGKPTIYTNPMPIWTDPNLAGLGHVLKTDLWLAYVRSATRLTDISHANTQPFYNKTLLYAHNGYIDQFGETLRHNIRHALESPCEKTIHGNTDSEYLFALLRQSLLIEDNIEKALLMLFDQLVHWAGNVKLLLNIVIANKEKIVSVRHAINGDCPSLYYSTGDDFFNEGMVVASEALSDDESWQTVPPHHMLTLTRDHDPALLAL